MLKPRRCREVVVARWNITARLGAVLCVGLSVVIGAAAPPKPPASTDPLGVEWIDKICDMREGAPISDKCYGFVAGVMESMDANNAGEGHDTFCPKDAKISDFVSAVRKDIIKNGNACFGMCTSETWVSSALYRAYPCDTKH